VVVAGPGSCYTLLGAAGKGGRRVEGKWREWKDNGTGPDLVEISKVMLAEKEGCFCGRLTLYTLGNCKILGHLGRGVVFK
jgi:hypothetical protein